MSTSIAVLAEILRQRSEAQAMARDLGHDIADERRAYHHVSWRRNRGWWRGECGRLGLDHYEACARFILETGPEPEQSDQNARYWFFHGIATQAQKRNA